MDWLVSFLLGLVFIASCVIWIVVIIASFQAQKHLSIKEIVIDDEIMDIKLLDAKNNYIDKNSLSKGEQQLYATALLKALVDESGIKFPVFIDSPLQKFDKEHSNNIINEFYPYISEQVVLLPLIEKELSVSEYNSLKSNINKVFIWMKVYFTIM